MNRRTIVIAALVAAGDPDEAHRPATEPLRHPGLTGRPRGPSPSGASVEETAATSRWRRALGTAVWRLRPKQND